MGTYAETGEPHNNHVVYKNLAGTKYIYVSSLGFWSMGNDLNPTKSSLYNTQTPVSSRPPTRGWRYYDNGWKEDQQLEFTFTQGSGEVSPPSSLCQVVEPGPATGQSCIFPFTWPHTGKTYTTCVYEPSLGDEWPWCSTKVNVNDVHMSGEDAWGKCHPQNCPIADPASDKREKRQVDSKNRKRESAEDKKDGKKPKGLMPMLVFENDFVTLHPARKSSFTFYYPQKERRKSHVWYHYCHIFDSRYSRIKAYINGDEVLNKREENFFLNFSFSDKFLGSLLLGSVPPLNGKISGLNMWSTALSKESILLEYSCAPHFETPDLINWDTAAWTRGDGVTLETDDEDNPCTGGQNSEEIFSFGPLVQQEALRTCSNLGGSMPLPRNQNELEHIKERVDKGLCQRQFWIPIQQKYPNRKDIWVDKDKEEVSYLQWGESEPNGLDFESCVIHGKRGYADMTCLGLKGGMCYYCKLDKHRILFRIRGLLEACRHTKVDTKFYFKPSELVDQKPSWEGEESSTLFWSEAYKRWQISFYDQSEPLLIYNRTQRFPLGLRHWILMDPTCRQQGNHVELMLSKCDDNEFSCGGGECIPEDEKCDGVENCDDESDEDSCDIIRFGDHSHYKKQVEYLGKPELTKYSVKCWSMRRNRQGKVIVSVGFNRLVDNILFSVYLPTAAIMIIAQLTLYFKSEHFKTAVPVALTSMLVMYTLYQAVSRTLPPTSYLKLIDLWLLFGLIFPFFVFVVLVLVDHLPTYEEVYVPTIARNEGVKSAGSITNVLSKFSNSGLSKTWAKCSFQRALKLSSRYVFPFVELFLLILYWSTASYLYETRDPCETLHKE